MGVGAVVVAGGTAAITAAAGYAYLNQLRAEAAQIAAANGITDPLFVDAFRHTYTSAELARLTSNEALVKTSGDMVELANPKNWTGGISGERDRNQDLLNNRTGREIGATSSSKQDSINKTIAALKRGDLVTKPQDDPRTYPEHFPKDLIPWPFPDSEAPPSPYIDKDPHQCTPYDNDGDGIPNVIDPYDSTLKPDISDRFNGAQKFRPRYDPLTLDLDGDGIETIGFDPAHPIYFDHDLNGVKEGTGWVKSDDGFLVLDRNGNGIIDNGAELFGDHTPLAGGGNAADGFVALAAEDTNLDGKVDASDARFTDLRIWRDLNQDGISQASELTTLAEQNIAAINVAKTANSQTLANGNQIADLGTYTRTDGSTGGLGETHQLADVNLAADTFHRQFITSITPTAETAALPNMQGSGAVRDLREVANDAVFEIGKVA